MEEDIIQIIEPSEEVFEKTNFYIDLVQKILPDATVTLIGSLAIPICIKNEIDLLVEIDEAEDIKTVQEKVGDGSDDIFGVGPIDKNEGFSRSKKKHGMICELHILHKGDERIKKYLAQVERFRSDSELASKYNELKKSLDGVPSSVYKEAKSKFLKENNLR